MHILQLFIADLNNANTNIEIKINFSKINFINPRRVIQYYILLT